MRPVATRLGLSLLSAALLFLSVPTIGLWPLMWVALVPQMWVALDAPTHKRAFLYGWLTGTVANWAAFSWMGGLLERFGHMPAVEALPIILLLVGYQGLAFALFAWMVRRFHRQTRLPLAVLAPLVMVAIEVGMPQMFPYYLAISQAFEPILIQIADLTGPLGVTALLLALNGAVLDAWRLRDRGVRVAGRNAAIVGALIVADLVYGAVRMHQVDARRAAAPKVKTGIVQANVGIIEKWDPRAFARLLATHQSESAELARAGAQLIVWPESSYPYALRRAPGPFERDFAIEDGRRVRRGFEVPLLFGAVTRGTGAKYPYNTALMMNAAGEVTGTYDKVFLMLFGEYIPFYDAIPWFTKVFPEASNFSRGSEPATFPLEVDGRDYRLGPLICYEDILPGFARRVAKREPQRVHQHHQRRLVRPHRRAVPAPGARGVPFGRAPHRDDSRREHGGFRAHRRRRPGPRADRVGRSGRAAAADAQDVAGRPGDASRRRAISPRWRPVRARLPGRAGGLPDPLAAPRGLIREEFRASVSSMNRMYTHLQAGGS